MGSFSNTESLCVEIANQREYPCEAQLCYYSFVVSEVRHHACSNSLSFPYVFENPL